MKFDAEWIAVALERLVARKSGVMEISKGAWNASADCSQFVLKTPDGVEWDIVVRERD